MQDPMDPELRDYYVALADQEYPDIDLWKAYWLVQFSAVVLEL